MDMYITIKQIQAYYRHFLGTKNIGNVGHTDTCKELLIDTSSADSQTGVNALLSLKRLLDN